MVHTGDGVSYLEEVVENSGMVHNGDGRGSDEWDNGGGVVVHKFCR